MSRVRSSSVASQRGPWALRRPISTMTCGLILEKLQGNPVFDIDPVDFKPPLKLRAPKADSYGGVLFNDEGHVLLREPKGHFGQYVWTFPKGGRDAGESAEQAALREVLEETGYHAEIINVLPKAFGGTTTTTAFFLMKPVGPQGEFHDETAQTRWATIAEAKKLIAMTKTSTGRARDLEVLATAVELFQREHGSK